MKLPNARTENLLEQYIKDETLIYDLNTNKAFTLNETSSIVYKACDGQTTFEGLRKKHNFTDDLIHLALYELKANDLLKSSYDSPFVGISRREVIRRVGLASMIALPLIVGLSAPSAAHAASGGCRTNVCYPAGFALCNACPMTVNVTFYQSQNGSCTTTTVTANDNCSSGRYTVPDAKVNFIV